MEHSYIVKFTNCTPALCVVLECLPLKQWFILRRVSTAWKSAIDGAIKGVKRLHSGNVCTFFDDLLRWLKREDAGIWDLRLPLFPSQLSGFSKLKKLEIHLQSYDDFQLFVEYTRENSLLESLTIVWVTEKDLSEELEQICGQKLKELRLDGIETPRDIWFPGTQLLPEAFPEHFPNLQRLHFPSKLLYPRGGITKDLSILASCKQLRFLSLPKIVSTHDSVAIFIALLGLPDLQELIFPSLASFEVSQVTEVGIIIGKELRSLKFLDLSPNQGNPLLVSDVVGVISEIRSLTHLSLDSAFEFESVWDLRNLRNLTSLTLTKLSPSCLEPLCFEVLNSSLEHLRSLDIHLHEWNQDEGRLVLDRDLRELKVDTRETKGPIGFACGPRLKSSLERLEVLRLGTTELADFLPGLIYGCSALIHLDLSQCFGCTPATIACIRDCLPQLRTLLTHKTMFTEIYAAFH